MPRERKVRHPGVLSSSCGRMAVTEMSSATLLDALATPDPAAEGDRMARYRYIAAVNAESLELQ
jgi:hypothetical protein